MGWLLFANVKLFEANFPFGAEFPFDAETVDLFALSCADPFDSELPLDAEVSFGIVP